MPCTSGFMDDITFGRNGPYDASGVAIPGRSLMSMNAFFLFQTVDQKHVCGINITEDGTIRHFYDVQIFNARSSV